MNKHLIEVRYIPASASKPARISLTSHWDGSRVITMLKMIHEYHSCCSWEDYVYAAPFQLKKMGFKVSSFGKMKRGYFIIVNEFKSLKGN